MVVNIEKQLKEYVDNKGFAISVISKRTGVSDNALYNSLGGSRKLRGNELILVCGCLEIDPMTFFNQQRHSS